MSSPVAWPTRGKRAGRRGSVFTKSLKRDASKLVPHASITAIKTIPAKIFYPGQDVDEVYNPETDTEIGPFRRDPVTGRTVETPHGNLSGIETRYVKDKSATNRNLLKLLPVWYHVKIVDMPGKQMDHAKGPTSGQMIATSDTKAIGKPLRSLLVEHNPFGSIPWLQRETSGSKRKLTDKDDRPAPREKVTDLGVTVDFDDDAPKAPSKRTSGTLYRSKLTD